MSDDPARWRIELTLPGPDDADPFEAALDGLVSATALSEISDGGAWILAAYCAQPPDPDDLLARLASGARGAGLALPEYRVKQVPDTDWVRHFQANTPPVTAGRFHVHGSHVTAPPPDGLTAICLDAGPAFGTGAHESTSGCLIALDRLGGTIAPDAILDMGCGSGILAIAGALVWDCPVLACDNDPLSVAECARNARRNAVAERVRPVLSEGFAGPEIARNGPYGLIAANILAGPLIAMAGALARHLAPGGVVILSGILDDQADTVLDAYGAHGLTLRDRVALPGWPTLILGQA